MAKRLKPNTDVSSGGELTKETFRSTVIDLKNLKRDHRGTVDEARRANAAVRDQRKAMKRMGVDLDTMDDALRITEMEPDDQMVYMSRLNRYLGFLNSPAALENDPFAEAEEVNRKHNERGAGLINGPDDRALHEGAMAFSKDGSIDDNPYPPGSSQAQAWEKGYREEQADNLAGLGAGGKKADGKKKSSTKSGGSGKGAASAADDQSGMSLN